METDALRAPVAVGLNVTAIEHIALTVRLAPQLLVWEKSPLLAPVMLMEMLASAAVPVLVRLTFCGELLVPTI